MAGVLDNVDQRTRLAGENRMELLLFRLMGKQKYGINVFKVQEVIHCPELSRVANGDPNIVGITNIRGKTITVIDLSKAVGGQPIEDIDNSFVIVTEFNKQVQGFLVHSVDRIVNMKWADIKAPPRGLGKNNFMTAVTQVDEVLVEIIDVEKVLSRMNDVSTTISDSAKQMTRSSDEPVHVLVVDDSSVARNQIKRTLEQMNIEPVLAINGQDGLNKLKEMVADGQPLRSKLDVVISDIEMPEMDGYTLTSAVREDPRMQDLHVVLHSSLSGVFNQAMVKKVGADNFLAKFSPDKLASLVSDRIKSGAGDT